MLKSPPAGGRPSAAALVAEPRLQVGQHRGFGEVVVAGRHRRVGGEHRVRRDGLDRRLERAARRARQAAHALEDQERGVALVDVPDGRLEADRGERARAADAEHDLLLEARDAVAAVEAVGDVAVALAVLRQVGVEEVQRDVADPRLPDLDEHFALRERRFDAQVAPVRAHRLDRQVVEVRVVVLGALAALAVDRLHEVALAVEQADGDERQLEVARRLAVVAGEDAEAAGVDRQALVHAELGAEIRHQVVARGSRRSSA